MSTTSVSIAILGATGMVGQTMVQLLSAHPWFDVVFVGASQRSMGRRYDEATRWRLSGEIPPQVGELPVLPCDPTKLPGGVRVVLSALDSKVAGPIERAFADAGYMVVTNASAWRMHPDVPLVIPEVNPDHLELLQRTQGGILANPNCCAIPLAMALAPLHRKWTVESVTVATWQAVSGAGYPGESAWDMVGNVHPHAGDEETRLAQEPLKILGSSSKPAEISVSARCVRVPVADGHLLGVHVRLKDNPSPSDVAQAMSAWMGQSPQLPSCPAQPLRISPHRDRPSPRFDASADGGMAVTIGRIEACPVMGVKFFAMASNTIRGAAGAAIANAELLLYKDLI